MDGRNAAGLVFARCGSKALHPPNESVSTLVVRRIAEPSSRFGPRPARLLHALRGILAAEMVERRAPYTGTPRRGRRVSLGRENFCTPRRLTTTPPVRSIQFIASATRVSGTTAAEAQLMPRVARHELS